MTARTLFFTIAAAFCVVLTTPTAKATDVAPVPLTGQYRCVRVEAVGKTAQCQSPPLTLNRDGSYQIWGEKGTYEVVQGKWLVLSHSKRRGLGHVVNAQEIVFEYRIGNETCHVTFRRVYNTPAGFRLS